MKKKSIVVILISTVVVLAQIAFTEKRKETVSNTLAYFQKEATVFSTDAAKLHEAIKAINTLDGSSVAKAKTALTTCREQYKRISYFMEYFFPSEAHVYNAAAVTEVEDAELEFIEPMGLQQIESLLYDPGLKDHIQELILQSETLYGSAADIRSLLYHFAATDAQIMESLRIELIRVITLYITGYDAPQLKTGITEAHAAITAIHHVVNFYTPGTGEAGRTLDKQFEETERYLAAHTDFDTFSRMEFLLRFALPLQQTLGLFIKSLQLELNTQEYLNYDVPNIFSRGAVNTAASGRRYADSGALVQLGKMLFTAKALSANNTRSCATCHSPGLYFTDMLPKSRALNGHAISRNAPTLLYAGMQHAQFWDGRASSLMELIRSVILNTEEMSGNEQTIMHRLMRNTAQQAIFTRAFPAENKAVFGMKHLSLALAAYIETLSPMTSPFDRYMQGDKQAMNENQVKGFDLFMGKAKCATCHFAPVFNSSLPPLYNLTEYEVIGSPANEDLAHPVEDTDRGRFTTYPVRYYDGSFKTPTVRNAAKTAPYMHNGAFKSLDSVIAFYNKGGGHGIGLTSDVQTLSPEPLALSTAEAMQLIQFINALTDEPAASIKISKKSFNK